MPCRLIRSARPLVALCCLAASLSAGAQATKSSAEYPDSKIDVYAGYGYLHPINSGIDNKQYMDVSNINATVGVSYFFNHYVGVQAEGGYFQGSNEHLSYVPNCSGATCNQLVYTAQGGPIARFPMGAFIPFIHALGGGTRMNGPAQQPLMWGWGVTGGGGIDYVLPWFNKRIAIRMVQADFQYSQVVYGPLVLPAGTQGGFGELDNLKLSGGIVARFGAAAIKQPVMMGCSTEPATVHPGEPVAVTGSTLYLDPHKKATYSWSSNGGTIAPSGSTASIDTTGLAPGEYVVQGKVSEGSKARQNASCTAPFTVRPFDPPTLTCTATPSTTTSGTTVDISTTGTSPQNRPLTYSYTSTAGVITSNGPTAKLSTAGLPASLITVTCNAVDDLGQSAKATTGVTLSNPPVPVIPQTQNLCSIAFLRDKKRPVRVDNEAKGCLDDVALTLNQQTDAKLVLVGNASPEEKPENAAERALNARQYLTQEKGIDPSRIEVRVGDTSGRTANNILIPAGSTFNDANTQLFDEKAIVRHGQAYGTHGTGTVVTKKPVRHRRKATAAPAVDATVPTTQP